MKGRKKSFWFAFVVALAFLVGVSSAYAMTVFLRDGRIVTVPVAKEDILGISFEENHSAMGGKVAAYDIPVTNGLVMWLDASDMSSLFQTADGTEPVVAGNQPVGQWQDKSGNDNHFLQSRQEACPRFVKTGIGGKPSVMFDTRQSLSLTGNFPAPVTVIYVVRQTGGANNRVLSAVANNWLLGYWSGAKNQAFYEGWVSPSGNPATDSISHVFSGIVRGPGQNSEVWADGVMVAANQNGVTGPNGLAVNAGAYPGEVSNCQIAELIVFNRDLSRSERQDVEAYLKAKWSIKR